MTKTKELISIAVQQRLQVVKQRLRDMQPAEFNESSVFVSLVTEQSLASSSDDVRQMLAGESCLKALQQLVLDGIAQATPPAIPSPDTDAAAFISSYKSNKSSVERFELLITRYSNPASILADTDADIRELLLERLMVQDRAKLEARRSFTSEDEAELLLKLNLISLYAPVTDDLRFLDALNYYYELLPESFHKNSQRNWLLVAYWVLYARALSSFA